MKQTTAKAAPSARTPTVAGKPKVTESKSGPGGGSGLRDKAASSRPASAAGKKNVDKTVPAVGKAPSTVAATKSAARSTPTAISRTPLIKASSNLPEEPSSNVSPASVQEPAEVQQVGNINVQEKSFEPRIGLARVLTRRLALTQDTNTLSTSGSVDTTSLKADIENYYREAIGLCPRYHDAYIELGGFLEQHTSLVAAADLYATFPFERNTDPKLPETSQDDLYIDSEITRIFMKLKRFRDPVLIRSLIAEGRAMGIGVLGKNIETLDAAGENKTLMEVYAGVNRKALDDPEMVAFFKIKYWI
ncbi:uncharacterized protein SPPG_06751 [Spizellomyces punctatus DAOM BR117]|uniref:Uncharacterized protein n=1 Tax=Spizellomyces punctatus (strain DAOM BR117) TaxID=645134 RepID=A0A0L0H8A3_SPIPD|nr:uncharacterized protein SPPG_06751 [Spizellomyces punctatus DAOM BR117]KNC97750.1 hypothetical protein SPPG_06751 [Spizellomyces punctatus DAOM BR117]|eukprot:XP_016605790.1 hypothetical protein SPPG_06751 [Spizellomyces punctatus DAOM BR117]